MRKTKNIFVHGPVTAERIATSIQAHSNKKSIGAHSIFLGQVRDDEKESGSIRAINYSAYESMANEKAHEIRELMFGKYPLTCMHIFHSLGEIKAGEICLFVFVSSPRRAAAISACAELVELIKKELPVWGEELTGQESSWKVNS